MAAEVERQSEPRTARSAAAGFGRPPPAPRPVLLAGCGASTWTVATKWLGVRGGVRRYGRGRAGISSAHKPTFPGRSRRWRREPRVARAAVGAGAERETSSGSPRRKD